eukprot:TRINITY_DN13022_c0_g1_i1.p1 TRINITY_DN13022_c0_g1~~TRINITY_DN13022_c0_g1_i1.p1  ORF type:complete len:293 (+),score=71.86 TRINITY_DN13022_c0_g1_i1:3-881(+)
MKGQVLIKRVKEVLRMVEGWKDELGVEEEKQLLGLEKYLLEMKGKRECLYALALYRRLIDNGLISNVFLYRTALRSLSINAHHLDLTTHQISSLLLSLSTSMNTTFQHSPIPYLGSVLPLYVKTCVGLGVPEALEGAKDGLKELVFPQKTELLNGTNLVGAVLEDFAQDMYLLARSWDRQSFKKEHIIVITKAGRKKVVKRHVSKYHYNMVTALQTTIFDSLEMRTSSYLPHLPTQPEILIGTEESHFFDMQGMNWTEHGAQHGQTATPQKPVQYRRLFKRKVKLPKVEEEE